MPADRRANVLRLVLTTEVKPHAHSRSLWNVHEEKRFSIPYVKAIHRRHRCVDSKLYNGFAPTALILD
jgi:hypothetical protein